MNSSADSEPENGKKPASPPPATSMFFFASLIAVVLNIGLVALLRHTLEPSPKLFSGWTHYAIYCLAALVGARHLLRIMYVDDLVTGGRLVVYRKLIFHILFYCTILGSIVFTFSIAGVSWYVYFTSAYLGFFVIWAALVFMQGLNTEHDFRAVFFGAFADLFTIILLFELKEVLVGTPDAALSELFWLGAVVILIVVSVEYYSTYRELVKNRIVLTWTLLSNPDKALNTGNDS